MRFEMKIFVDLQIAWFINSLINRWNEITRRRCARINEKSVG